MSAPSVMLVAGEASGDLHAANLVRELKRRCPDLQAFGLGGGLMAAAGVELAADLVSHAVIGVFEAVRKLGEFARALRLAKELLRERRPAVLVLIDFPDLNFRIAVAARRLGIPVVYYISPQVWAWRRGRVKTLRRLVDLMIVVFPFEEPIYREAGVPVVFVGHPLLDLAKPEEDPQLARARLLGNAQGPLVGLLPGSRSQEIELLLPVLCQAGLLLQRDFPEARFFLPLARTVSQARVTAILQQQGLEVALVTEKPYACRAAADLALVASGTATLETAILGVPQLIVYRLHAISYLLSRLFVRLPYFGLANLASGAKVAPEFLQGQVTAAALAQAAKRLLTDPEAAAAQRRAWQNTRTKLGGPGAAGRAAEAVLDVLRKRGEPPKPLRNN